MGFTQIFITVLIYVVLFFVLERVSFKDDATLKNKIIYAVLFALLIILYNLFLTTIENPPELSVTIFQIGFVVVLSVSYIIWKVIEQNKKI